MTRPTQPKGNKPGDNETPKDILPVAIQKGLDTKFIILIAVIALSTVLASVGGTYLISTQILLPSMLKQLSQGQEAPDEGGEEEGNPENTINLNLNDFTVNLKNEPDMAGNQYLKTKISLVVTVHEEQNCNVTADEKKGEGGKEGGKDIVVCMEAFQSHMGKFTPAIRDIINSALMSRTSAQLASIEGQESLKDEIKENINGIIDAHHKIIRVNFEDFIVQR